METLILASPFIVIFLIIAIHVVNFSKKNKKKINMMPDMSDTDFITGIKKNVKCNLDETQILKLRKLLVKKLWIPYNKISPDLKLNDFGESIFNFYLRKDTDYLVEDTLEDLFYRKKFSLEEVRAIHIETVSDYIYYSAIVDGKIQVLPKKKV